MYIYIYIYVCTYLLNYEYMVIMPPAPPWACPAAGMQCYK